MPAKIRKLIVEVDETHLEAGKAIDPPTRKALAMAVIENPYAGRYVENLDELIAIGEELGGLLGDKCVQALGIAPGAALDVPLTHINASYVRSHFDAMEVRVPGSPAADEIVFILVMSTGARVHARVGGLKAADIAQWNGLR